MAIVNLWGTPTPTLADDNAAAEQGINLGTVFKATVSGAITHLRYYETANAAGTVDLRLYSSAGAVLASTTHTAVAGTSGWHDVALGTPYTVTVGTYYMVAYHIPIRSTSNNTYATFSPNLSAVRSSSGGELQTAADGAVSFNGNSGNGRYGYGGLALPPNTFNSESYAADVVFDTSGGGGTDGSVTGVTATATGSATAPTVTGGAGVTGVTATATGSATAPTVIAGAAVTGVTATATADALVPTVAAAADASVTAVTATSTARGWEPVVGASFEVIAVTATASAAATAPVVLAGAGVSPGAAAALGFGQAPSVTGGFAVDVAPPAATATADGQVPLVEAGALVLAVAAAASADAPVPLLASGAFAVPAATATALAWRPTLDPAPEGGIDSGMSSEELQHAMQRVSGTTLDAQGAANVWAGTVGLELLAALNAKAGNTEPRGLLAVLNQLAGTANLDVAGAAARIPA